MRHMHTFGCPVFALQNKLASGSIIPKWSPRCRLGLNLGPSPSHARNVYMVLDIKSGLVSPQFHIKFDDLFETTRLQSNDVLPGPTPAWKSLAGLIKIKNSLLPPHVTLHQATVERVVLPSEGGIQDEATILQEDTVFEQPGDEEKEDEDEPPPLERSRSANRCHHAARREESRPTSTLEAWPNVPNTTSSRGRIRKPSKRLAESTAQRAFHGEKGYYVANSAQIPSPDQAHDKHLGLQERMRHPVAFHAEMMGDNMYYHQAIKQDDAR